MIEFSCKNCGQKLNVEEKHASKKIKCPKCGELSVVPPKADKITFQCANCGQSVRVLQIHAGKKGRCPKCNQLVVIPSGISEPKRDAETFSILGTKCEEEIRVPKTTRGKMIECPECGSYVETSSEGRSAVSAEPDPSIPSEVKEDQYEEESYAKKIERNEEPRPQKTLRILAIGIAKILAAALILVGAFAAYRYQMNTSPRAGRQKPPPQPKLVQVISVRKADCTTTVTGDAVVMPAQQVILRPQVTGQLVEISDDVVPGGIVRLGQKLMAIDRRDYDILVRQRQYEVARALKDLKLEQGNQAIARQEYELLGEVISEEDRELVLREPQLASAQAAEESAKAALKKAQLDLARCNIVAPFNAIIQDKHVDLGATVSANTDLVTLIGTDEVWVEVKVWIDKLTWLTIPRQNGDPGSSVKIYNTLAWGADRFRTGRVLCLIGELETQGRLARLLVAVDDPFCLKRENRELPQLLIGSYVSAEIQGRTLTSVFPVKWSHLRGENNKVWIMDDEGKLEIRPVQVVFRDGDQVYVTEGLTEDENLVFTDIAAPIEGMPLRVAPIAEQRLASDQVPGQKGERR